MKRLCVGLFALAAAASIGWACAGGGYETSFTPEASSAFLSPGNDTRTNFVLLMADAHGTKVADAGQMAKGIVPFDFPYSVLVSRMAPPAAEKPSALSSYEEEQARYGLSEDNRYFGYDADNIGLCHTNRSGAEQFAAALAADRSVPAAEKAALVAAREALGKGCDKASEMQFAFEDVASPAGRAYAHYVDGARYFYAEDFASARQQFAEVGQSVRWLADTAGYMQFRTALAESTKHSIGKYGDMAKPAERDQGAIERAETFRLQYLSAFPNGRYANSARNLGRRIVWLRGDRRALGSAYSMLTGQVGSKAGEEPDFELIDEIDIKLLPDGDGPGVTDPILLAVVDLLRLRQYDDDYDFEGDYRGPKLERAELDQQRPYFNSNPALFDYLRAVEAFYGRKQPKEVLALIPDAAGRQRFSYVEFSRQMLRGLALEAVKDRNARGFWLSLFPGAVQPYQREAVELALARHDGDAGQPERMFAADSPVRHLLIRQNLLEENAGPVLLRQQAQRGPTPHEREVSLYLLLAGEIHHGLYADFLRDAAMVGKRPRKENEYYYGWSVGSYDPTYSDELGPPPLDVFAEGGSADLPPCPDIRATAASLAADPAAIRPRLCLAEFIRRNGFDGWNQQWDGKTMAVRARNGFPGKQLERIDVYRSVIASPAASPDDKAFALNRAIRCFAPSGYSSCGGDEIPVEQRKAWFERLKRDYPQSTWARDLKVYW